MIDRKDKRVLSYYSIHQFPGGEWERCDGKNMRRRRNRTIDEPWIIADAPLKNEKKEMMRKWEST